MDFRIQIALRVYGLEKASNRVVGGRKYIVSTSAG